MSLWTLLKYIFAALAALLLTPLLGAQKIDFMQILMDFHATDNTSREILFSYRLPRTVLCFLCGGGLALTGAAFQAIFRNPLVEPYTLGIAGGAAVGAYLAIAFPGIALHWGVFGSQQLFALCGAGAVLLLVRRIAGKNISPQILLLGGLTISIICGGVIVLLTYIVSPHQLAAAQRWMLGGFDYAGYKATLSLLPFYLPGAGLLFYFSPAFNVLNLGEEAAEGLGVDTRAVYAGVFTGGGLLTAAVVSLAGPVAFIGLIIPHFTRRLSGYDQRLILPCAFLLGGAALCVSDMFARSAMSLFLDSPTEFPAGIITALVGGPLFVHMLYRSNDVK